VAARAGAEAALPDYDPQTVTRGVDRTIATYTRAALTPRPGRGSPTDVPVFVVGMPRSGTTLIEQILSRHSRILGAGELSLVPKITQEWRQLEQLLAVRGNGPAPAIPDDVVIAKSASFYLKGLQRRITDGSPDRIIDKLPFNLFQLGTISTMFPNAPIIFTERDPRDVAISCFFERFTRSHDYSYRLDWLGNMITQADRARAHFRAVLPNPWMTVCYEDLVHDPEPVIRAMLEFLGLDWQAACLSPEDNRNTVQTASISQVRRKINTGSVARWRRYQTHLAPLFEVIGWPETAGAA